jgi:hypothetical protein
MEILKMIGFTIGGGLVTAGLACALMLVLGEVDLSRAAWAGMAGGAVSAYQAITKRSIF